MSTPAGIGVKSASSGSAWAGAHAGPRDPTGAATRDLMDRETSTRDASRDADHVPEQRRTHTPGSSSWPAFGSTAHLVVADRDRLEPAAELAAQLVSEVQHRCDARRPGAGLARANPARMLMRVVLPAPFGPSKPKNSPSSSVKLTSSRARVAPRVPA